MDPIPHPATAQSENANPGLETAEGWEMGAIDWNLWVCMEIVCQTNKALSSLWQLDPQPLHLGRQQPRHEPVLFLAGLIRDGPEHLEALGG